MFVLKCKPTKENGTPNYYHYTMQPIMGYRPIVHTPNIEYAKVFRNGKEVVKEKLNINKYDIIHIEKRK